MLFSMQRSFKPENANSCSSSPDFDFSSLAHRSASRLSSSLKFQAVVYLHNPSQVMKPPAPRPKPLCGVLVTSPCLRKNLPSPRKWPTGTTNNEKSIGLYVSLCFLLWLQLRNPDFVMSHLFLRRIVQLLCLF